MPANTKLILKGFRYDRRVEKLFLEGGFPSSTRNFSNEQSMGAVRELMVLGRR